MVAPKRVTTIIEVELPDGEIIRHCTITVQAQPGKKHHLVEVEQKDGPGADDFTLGSLRDAIMVFERKEQVQPVPVKGKTH